MEIVFLNDFPTLIGFRRAAIGGFTGDHQQTE
jgi:hypothetical protein